MNKSTIYMLISMMVIVGWIIVMVGNTVLHEEIHKQIFTYYNMDSKIDYSFFSLNGKMGSVTATSNFTNCQNPCISDHVSLENFGYLTEALAATIFILVWIIFLGLYFLERHNESHDLNNLEYIVENEEQPTWEK